MSPKATAGLILPPVTEPTTLKTMYKHRATQAALIPPSDEEAV